MKVPRKGGCTVLRFPGDNNLDPDPSGIRRCFCLAIIEGKVVF